MFVSDRAALYLGGCRPQRVEEGNRPFTSESRYTRQRELEEQTESSDRPWNRLFALRHAEKYNN